MGYVGPPPNVLSLSGDCIRGWAWVEIRPSGFSTDLPRDFQSPLKLKKQSSLIWSP